MTTFLTEELSDETQHLYAALAESFEAGDRVPAKQLIAYLRHPEDGIRKLAVQLLEHHRLPSTIPALLNATADTDWEISELAGEQLRNFHQPEAVGYLVAGLNHAQPAVRLAAVVALRDRRAELAIAPLIQRLADPEVEIRRETLLALAHYHRSEVLPEIRARRRDGNAAVRRTVVEIIATFDSAFVYDDLIASLSDSDWQVRKAAVAGLGRFPSQATQNALYSTLLDSAWQVVREAALSLARIMAPADDRIVNLLAHELADIRLAAIQVFAAAENPAGIADLWPHSGDSNGAVARAAQRAIEKLNAIRRES